MAKNKAFWAFCKNLKKMFAKAVDKQVSKIVLDSHKR